ncbi:sodium-dependent multivitamin transporter-like [Amphiura filiformis]|uniref:sodium-dependent multivitamin transporter-like n=1 Tax=Amphiura filiformis TaxID=82378 RepID=UPI003B217E79
MPLWAVSQTSVQRMLSAKTLTQAKISVWLNLPFVSLIKFLQCFQGLMMYAYYFASKEQSLEPTQTTEAITHKDTLLTTDAIAFTADSSSPVVPKYTKPDQILIYYISGQFGNIPGFQGLFIACIFAGTLSTVSSGLNALVAVTLIDIIRPFRTWIKSYRWISTCHQQGDNESTDLIIIKILTLVYGAVTTGLAFLATNYGTLVSMIYRLFGSVGGPLVGVFITGMFWRRANARGALVGLLSGVMLGMWLIIGTRVNADDLDNALPLYKLSFTWYATFTTITTVVVTCLVSEVSRCLSRTQDHREVNDILLATFLREGGIPTCDDNANDKIQQPEKEEARL